MGWGESMQPPATRCDRCKLKGVPVVGKCATCGQKTYACAFCGEPIKLLDLQGKHRA